MTTPHPNADLLRAIADGRQMQIKRSSEWRNCDASTALAGLASVAPHHIRIKPDTVTVNGIECNAPMRVASAAQPPTHDGGYPAELRDYFAAAALQGWLASFGVEADHPAVSCCSATVARQAYVMADAMLEAREAK